MADASQDAYYQALLSAYIEQRNELDRTLLTFSWASIGGLAAVAITNERLRLAETILGGFAATMFALCMLVLLYVQIRNADLLKSLVNDHFKGGTSTDTEQLQADLKEKDQAAFGLFLLGLFFTLAGACAVVAQNGVAVR